MHAQIIRLGARPPAQPEDLTKFLLTINPC